MTDHAPKTKGLIWLAATCALAVAFAPWHLADGAGRALGVGAAPGEDDRIRLRGESLSQHFRRTRCCNEAAYVASTRFTPDDAAFSIEVRVVKAPLVNAYASA